MSCWMSAGSDVRSGWSTGRTGCSVAGRRWLPVVPVGRLVVVWWSFLGAGGRRWRSSVLDGRTLTSRPSPGWPASRIRSGHYSTVTTQVSTLLKAAAFLPLSLLGYPFGQRPDTRGTSGPGPSGSRGHDMPDGLVVVRRSQRSATPGRVGSGALCSPLPSTEPPPGESPVHPLCRRRGRYGWTPYGPPAVERKGYILWISSVLSSPGRRPLGRPVVTATR